MQLFRTALSISLCIISGNILSDGSPVAAAPNGIQIPANYNNWRIIGTSHREDNQTLRVIVGNDVAVRAARTNKTNPWPEGSILGKLVWKDEIHPKWPKAIVPGEFVHSEFMIKDTAEYQETGGWGFARWLGMNQTPFGQDKGFVKECMVCHEQVKDNDFVFTRPAPLP